MAIYLCVILLLTGCGEKEEVQEKQEPKKGSVYFLNNKIETQDIYEEIANAYEEKTGVKVTVRSVSENSYQETLEAEMAGTDTPSLFMIQGIGNFAREVVRYMNDEDWENVPWVSAAFPDGTFSDVVGENLMKMLDDKMDFATFAQKFREEWQKVRVLQRPV